MEVPWGGGDWLGWPQVLLRVGGGSTPGWGHPHTGREGGSMSGGVVGRGMGAASMRMRFGAWLCPGTLSGGWPVPS